MKKPRWAKIVGILGIIFGCLGILSGGQEIFMSQMMKIQKEMFTEMHKRSTEKQVNTSPEASEPSQEQKKAPPDFSPEVFKSMEKMWEVPDWFDPFSIFAGIAKALISALYLLASIWLLQIKPISIRLFYWAAGLSIGLSVLKGAVMLSALSFMGMAIMFGSVFGALIDIILIIVVATGNKEAFQHQPAQQPA